MHSIQSEILNFLNLNANASNAIKMKAYLKDKFDLHGIKSPERKLFFKSLWRENKNIILTDWQELTKWLWEQDYRECHYLAMDIIGKIEKKLTINDLPLIESFILKHSWWDTVDFLASHGIGQILKEDQKMQFATVERFLNSNNMWLKRTAIIFQLFYKNNTNKDLLLATIDANLGSNEFFINKAIGWALRQYSRVNPIAVRQYIEIQGAKMSGLSIREATKFL